MIPIPIIATIIVVLYILSAIKILREYERGVIFRLGRLLPHAKGPGIILVFAPVDRMVRISLRQEALEVPPQDIITRDNVTLKVNAVIFLRVIDPNHAVVEVSNYLHQTSQFAQTTLRSALGEVELDELLARREKINMRLQAILDTHTAPWGVKVANVEVKQVDMPESMLRAMAKQAEAEREKRSGSLPSGLRLGLPRLLVIRRKTCCLSRVILSQAAVSFGQCFLDAHDDSQELTGSHESFPSKSRGQSIPVGCFAQRNRTVNHKRPGLSVLISRG